MLQHKAPSKGFTLLEALVALVIAAIALGSLYRAVGQGAVTANAVSDRVEMAFIAHNIFSSAVFADDFESGSTGAEGRWFWKVSVAREMIHPRNMSGHDVIVPFSAGKIQISIYGSNSDVNQMFTAWKPFRVP